MAKVSSYKYPRINSSGNKDIVSVSDALIEYSNLPDNDERIGKGSYFYSHFFEPSEFKIDDLINPKMFDATRLFICGYLYDKEYWSIPDNASVAAYMFFLEALENFKSNSSDINKYLVSLGKAIHYMQDMCCIAHQKTWQKNLWDAVKLYHYAYEVKIDSFMKDNWNKFHIIYAPTFDFNLSSSDNKEYASKIIENCINLFVMPIYQTGKSKAKGYGGEICFEEIEYAYFATYYLIYAFFYKNAMV
ncbi:MAG: zinc dependent phospholipase C family protein [Clostridia bacterium]|nr:zinc dependent phospholipase C family protein [Clostridia bacterium]